jgi:hypothetical protein
MDQDLKQYLDSNFARIDGRDRRFDTIDRRLDEINDRIEKAQTVLLTAFQN